MTPPRKAHHNSHFLLAPSPLLAWGYGTTSDISPASKNVHVTLNSSRRCVVSQFGSAQHNVCDRSPEQRASRSYRCAHYDRTSTYRARFGCINQSTTLRISASNSIDTLASSPLVPRIIGEVSCTELCRSPRPKRAKPSDRLDVSPTEWSVMSFPTSLQCFGRQIRRRVSLMKSARSVLSRARCELLNAISVVSAIGQATLSLRSSPKSCVVTECGT